MLRRRPRARLLLAAAALIVITSCGEIGPFCLNVIGAPQGIVGRHGKLSLDVSDTCLRREEAIRASLALGADVTFSVVGADCGDYAYIESLEVSTEVLGVELTQPFGAFSGYFVATGRAVGSAVVTVVTDDGRSDEFQLRVRDIDSIQFRPSIPRMNRVQPFPMSLVLDFGLTPNSDLSIQPVPFDSRNRPLMGGLSKKWSVDGEGVALAPPSRRCGMAEFVATGGELDVATVSHGGDVVARILGQAKARSVQVSRVESDGEGVRLLPAAKHDLEVHLETENGERVWYSTDFPLLPLADGGEPFITHFGDAIWRRAEVAVSPPDLAIVTIRPCVFLVDRSLPCLKIQGWTEGEGTILLDVLDSRTTIPLVVSNR